MPAEQRGSVYPTKTGYGVRWLQDGRRRHQSGFPTKTAARNHFRDEVAPRLGMATSIDPSITLEAFVKLYLASHALNVEASTLTVLRSSLRAATVVFGDVPLSKLERQAPEIAAWRAKLAEGSRVGATMALRQCLDQAIAWGVIQRNAAKLAGKNTRPRRPEVVPFTPDELKKLCREIGQANAAIVRFAAATGMRPAEWIGLEWKDVRRDEGRARRAHVQPRRAARLREDGQVTAARSAVQGGR